MPSRAQLLAIAEWDVWRSKMKRPRPEAELGISEKEIVISLGWAQYLEERGRGAQNRRHALVRGGRGGGRGGRGAAGDAVRYREGREGAALSARRALSSPRPLLAAVQCRLASKRNSRPLHDLYSATRPRRRRPRARRPLGRRQGRAAGGLRRAALRPSGLRACTRPARRCREADSLADRSADVSAVEQTSSRTTARSLPSCTPGTPALRCRSCAMYVLTCGGAKETVSREMEMEMEHDRDSYSYSTRGCRCASAFPFSLCRRTQCRLKQLEGTVCWQWQEGGRGERINGRVRGAALATS